MVKDEAWPFTYMYWHATVLELYTYCEKVHTVRVNPMHACKVKELYDTDEHGELIEMKQSGAFQIVARLVQRDLLHRIQGSPADDHRDEVARVSVAAVLCRIKALPW